MDATCNLNEAESERKKQKRRPAKDVVPMRGSVGGGSPRHPADRLIRDRSRHTRLGPVGRAGVRIAAGLALDGDLSARPVKIAVRWLKPPCDLDLHNDAGRHWRG